MDEIVTGDRRPLKSRGTRWAAAATRLLLATRLSANAVSVLGILFAALGAWAAIEAPDRPLLYLAALAGIQLRLLCNMLDGLIAVEGGRGSPLGALFNEVPDRIEDSLLLAAFGIAAGSLALGLFAALLACFAAYLRLLGGTFGLPQDFRGPMAKPHRMAALSLTAIAALVEALAWGSDRSLAIGLWIIVAGTVVTLVRRTLGIARGLASK